MPVSSDNELRWLIGKVLHVANRAETLAQFYEFTQDVEPPSEVSAGAAREVDHGPRYEEICSWAEIAARALYGQGSADADRVAREVKWARARLAELPLARPHAEVSPSGARHEQAVDDSDAAESDHVPAGDQVEPGRAGDQHIHVDGDNLGPIINAPGGRITVQGAPERESLSLTDYTTLLIHATLLIKRRNSRDEHREVAEKVTDLLSRYHALQSTDDPKDKSEAAKLNSGGLIVDLLDEACLKFLGTPREKIKPLMFESPPPQFDLFSEMKFIPGGFDQLTHREVKPFYLAQLPITVGQYAEFCREFGWSPVPEWGGMAPRASELDHPVTGVTAIDAMMFCVWLEHATGFRFRLPTEPEWCFAATGGSSASYPWGDSYEFNRAITSRESPGGPQSVYSMCGESPFAIRHMSGNVWELTATLFDEAPTTHGMDVEFPPIMQALTRAQWWETDRRVPHGAGPWYEAARFVMKGGSWGGGPEWATTSKRIWSSLFNRGAYGGFRVACSAESVGTGWVPTPSFLSPRVNRIFERFYVSDMKGQAIGTKWFGACGGGSTFTGSLGSHLIITQLARYSSVMSENGESFAGDYDIMNAWPNRVAEASSDFPRLR